MAVPRPILLALIGVVLLAATFAVSMGSRNAASEQAAAPAQGAAPASSQPAALSPAEAMNAALSGGAQVTSAKFDFQASAKVSSKGRDERGSAEVSGAFQGRGDKQVPLFRVDVKAAGDGQRFSAGAVSLGDRGFLTQGNTAYQLPARIWKDIGGSRSKIAAYGSKKADGQAKPAPSGQAGVDASAFLSAPKDAGMAQVDGVATRHVTASVNPERAVRSLSSFAKQSGAAAQLPPNFEQLLPKVVKRADVEAFVGADRIPRRLAMTMDLDFRALGGSAARSAGNPGRATVELELRLSEVNKPQQIAAPSKVSSKPLKGEQAVISTSMLGAGALALDPPPGLARARQAGVRFDGNGGLGPAAKRVNRAPGAVKRAIKDKRKVVIFFHNARGVDDRLTAASVAELKRNSKVPVFSDTVGNVSSYGQLLASVGVSRTPSVVIVGKSGQARLVEGYIDPDALAQEVADAR